MIAIAMLTVLLLVMSSGKKSNTRVKSLTSTAPRPTDNEVILGTYDAELTSLAWQIEYSTDLNTKAKLNRSYEKVQKAKTQFVIDLEAKAKRSQIKSLPDHWTEEAIFVSSAQWNKSETSPTGSAASGKHKSYRPLTGRVRVRCLQGANLNSVSADGIIQENLSDNTVIHAIRIEKQGSFSPANKGRKKAICPLCGEHFINLKVHLKMSKECTLEEIYFPNEHRTDWEPDYPTGQEMPNDCPAWGDKVDLRDEQWWRFPLSPRVWKMTYDE